MFGARYAVHRFESTVLKDKSGSDKAQVPADAQIKFFKPGATVKAAVTIPVTINDPDPQPTTVMVYNPENLAVSQLLAVNTNATHQLIVAENPNVSLSTVKLLNLTASPIILAISDRLVRVNEGATLYSDPAATVPVGSQVNTDPATGRAGAYLLERRFDYVISGSGLTSRLYPGSTAPVLGASSWLNAASYPSLQAAVDAAVSLGLSVVYVPAGEYFSIPGPNPTLFTPPLRLPLDKPFRLVGDGLRRTTLKVVWQGGPFPDPNIDLIQIRGDHQTVEGFTLAGYPFGAGTGAGIRIGRNAGSNPLLFGIVVRDCEITEIPEGIRIDDSLLGGQRQFAVWGMYENIWVHHLEGGLGLYIGEGGTTTQYFNNCNFKDGGHRVLLKTASGIAFNNCIFEHGLVTGEPYVDLQGAQNCKLDHCWFEGLPNSGANPGPLSEFVRIGGSARAITLADCLFVQRGSDPISDRSVRAIRVTGPARGVTISNPFFVAPGDTSLGDKSNILIDAQTSGPQNEVVIVGGELVDGSGGVRLPHVQTASSKSTHLGTAWRVTLPRLSTAERDTLENLVGGELVFNTDANKVQVRGSGGWADV